MRAARPAKLKSGEWGAKVDGQCAVGDLLTITSSAGKTWTATVTAVVWTNGEVSLCATESQR